VTAPPRPPIVPTSIAELRALLARPLSELTGLQRFVRYFVVGGVATVVDYGLFASLFYLGIHYIVAATISFVFAVAVNYVLSIRFVFESDGTARHREIVLIYLVSGIGIAINLAILAVLVEWAQFHPLIGKLVGTALVLGWNFSARHFWIFAR
jgi:putative flippase GtrA